MEGVTFEPPAGMEDSLLDSVEDAAADIPGFAEPTNAAMLYVDDETYLVVSDEEIKTGETVATERSSKPLPRT